MIIPAILEENIDDYDRRLAELLKIPDLHAVQIDFSDGQFTPRQTLPIGELELLNPAYSWEAHLMVSDPRAYFFDAKLLGFSKIIFHFEAVNKDELEKIADEITELKMTPVLAFKPDTDPEQATPYLKFFQNFLVLGVNPGYQGQDFDPKVLGHVQNLRNQLKNAIIEVDGGVKISNIRQLKENGADDFVVGSALFADGTPAQNFEKFEQEIKT